MTSRRPRWAWLLFPQLSFIISASVLAANHRLPRMALGGGLDKLGHFLLLGGLALFAVGFFGRARWLRVAFVLAALSAVEELSQAWFPARTVDAWDLVANLTGILLGSWAGAGLTRPRAGYAAVVAAQARDKSPPLPITRDDDQQSADRPAVRTGL
jgi:VanZ family protein